tara:strand:+ start:23 stop:160 length:138 start_codon:yes stop_codon:yes gene_type:complete
MDINNILESYIKVQDNLDKNRIIVLINKTNKTMKEFIKLILMNVN